MFEQTVEKARGVVTNVMRHWSKPAKGNYVSYKEILNLGIGGMGVQFFTIVLAYFSLSSSSTLMGATLGIQPMHMQFIGILMSGLGTLIAIGRNAMMDNTHTKIGKFRPYIIFSGIPILVLAFIFVFLDFDKMSKNSHMPQFSPLRLAAYCRFILTPITRCHRLSPRTARNAEKSLQSMPSCIRLPPQFIILLCRYLPIKREDTLIFALINGL